MKQFLEDIWYWFYDHLIWPEVELSRHMKWFIQRGRRGYSDRDLWSLDCYIAGWMPEALEAYREEFCPSGLDKTEWDSILNDMIDAFDKANEISSGDLEWKTEQKYHKIFQKKGKLFIKYFFDLWT